MNSRLKHYQVRHTVSSDVLVTIDPDKFPDHSEQALKNWLKEQPAYGLIILITNNGHSQKISLNISPS